MQERNLLNVLRAEKASGIKGGIYHRIQVDMTYNSNHIEGSRLTHDQTRYIYETSTIAPEGEAVRVDDVIETVNHFRCIDKIIDTAAEELSEEYIKSLHALLKSGTADSRLEWFAVGEYKRFPNEVGGKMTVSPENTASEMKRLLSEYENGRSKTLCDIIDFHCRFERIHPFQDGNGCTGRLIMFKECLRNGIVPFIISDDLKHYYYRGIKEWTDEQGWLRDTMLTAQDRFKKWLDYFRIEY